MECVVLLCAAVLCILRGPDLAQGKVLHKKGLNPSRGTMVDATISPAPNATKNMDGERRPEMCQAAKVEDFTNRRGKGRVPTLAGVRLAVWSGA